MKLLSKILTITTSVLLAAGFLVASPSVMPTSASAETTISQLGLDIDGEFEGDLSGYSVAISSDGSRVVIGARQHNATREGTVRIYDWNGSAWIKVGADIDGEAAADFSGHAVSISPDGSRVAIGSPYNDGNGSAAGHVRMFDWNGTNWTRVVADISV